MYLIQFFILCLAVLAVSQHSFAGPPAIGLQWTCRQFDNFNGTNTSITEHANGTRVVSHEKVSNGTVCFPMMVPIDLTKIHERPKRQFKPKVRLQQALKFIKAYKLEKCSARIVCELSCDPDALGRDGKILYTKLTHMWETNNLPGLTAEQLAFYLDARQKGIDNKRLACKTCNLQYPECLRRSPSLIKMVAGVELIP